MIITKIIEIKINTEFIAENDAITGIHINISGKTRTNYRQTDGFRTVLHRIEDTELIQMRVSVELTHNCLTIPLDNSQEVEEPGLSTFTIVRG